MSNKMIGCRKKCELTPVLMLAPYFAPQTHAAMFRVHKLAKYLPEYGFKPVVITTDVNYLYNEDSTLLNELSADVQVHRVRFIEPTLRGVRMAFGGEDRTFAAMKRRLSHVGGVVGSSEPEKNRSSGVRGIYSGLVRLLGEWPDRHWIWSAFAHRISRRLVKEQGIRLMYTSVIPTSPLRSALSLKREFDLGWVADFRDPVGYGNKHSAEGVLAQRIERELVIKTMSSADMVTGLADSYGKIFFDLYGLPEDRYKFIPTGLDEAYLDMANFNSHGGGYLLHVGEVMPNQSDYAFKVLARLVKLQDEGAATFKLMFVGRREINEPIVRSMLGDVSGWPYKVEFVDHLPQREVYKLVQQAAACLLIPGRYRYWWTNFAKMVDYIGLGAPVIADVPVGSEAETELRRSGSGFFLSGEDVDADALRLKAWMNERKCRERNAYSSRYTAREQASQFAEQLNRLLVADRPSKIVTKI